MLSDLEFDYVVKTAKTVGSVAGTAKKW